MTSRESGGNVSVRPARTREGLDMTLPPTHQQGRRRPLLPLACKELTVDHSVATLSLFFDVSGAKGKLRDIGEDGQARRSGVDAVLQRRAWRRASCGGSSSSRSYYLLVGDGRQM